MGKTPGVWLSWWTLDDKLDTVHAQLLKSSHTKEGQEELFSGLEHEDKDDSKSQRGPYVLCRCLNSVVPEETEHHRTILTAAEQCALDNLMIYLDFVEFETSRVEILI